MQGSGKGTQSRFLAESCGFEIFEAGAELRRLANEDSELARKGENHYGSGTLVPEVVMVIEDFLHRLPEGKGTI